MFALGIRYLNGWALASDGSGKPEWPPHPDRVFMAMAAAYFASASDNGLRQALEWLETLAPPQIAASTAWPRDLAVAFVPVNDSAFSRSAANRRASLAKLSAKAESASSLLRLKKLGLEILPAFRSRQENTRPLCVPESPNVFLVWPDAVCPPTLINALERLCAGVCFVGEPSSLAQMWVEPAPPIANYLPVVNGLHGIASLRVFGRGGENGRLQRLEQHLQMENALGMRMRVVSDQIRYSSATTARPPLPPPAGSVFDPRLLVLRRENGPRLGLESAPQLIAALRGTLMSAFPQQPPPASISGHEANGRAAREPHIALLPFPDIDHDYASGDLLGLGIALPRGLPLEEEKGLGRILLDSRDGSARSIELRTAIGTWVLRLEDNDPRTTLQSATWSGPPQGSRVWGSVTPIAFDRHPKVSWSAADPPRMRAQLEAEYWAEVEEMVAAACVRIGLPKPAAVEARGTSPWRGAADCLHFPRLRRKDGSDRRQAHAIIKFDEPVAGPLLLGAGRFRGYGFCRPQRSGA